METITRHFRIAAILLIFSQGIGIWSTALFAAEQSILIIERSANAADGTNHNANATNPPPGTTNTYEVSSLADCATQILAGLNEGDCIKDLNFRGHGAPGAQSVGAGRKINGDKEIDTGKEEWKEALEGLKGKFCEGATITLWGCRVGAGEKGAKKLKDIANYFGITTRGTVNVVYAGQQNTYTGKFKVVEPDTPETEAVEPEEEKAPLKGAGGEIPTLTEWGMIFLLLTTLGFGVFRILRL